MGACDAAMDVEAEIEAAIDDLTEQEERPVDADRHSILRGIVGRAQWILRVRPDVLYAVKEMSGWLQGPREVDYMTARRLVKYLMSTREMAMTIVPEASREWKVTSSSDSDWAGCMASRRSTSAALVRLNGAVVSALCRNQTVLAMSSSEAECYACCVALAKAEEPKKQDDDDKKKDTEEKRLELQKKMEQTKRAEEEERRRRADGQRRRREEDSRQREFEERLKKVAGLDNTTDVATKHVDTATLVRCQAALGLIIFSENVRAAVAADGEDELEVSLTFVAVTGLALVGLLSLLEKAGRVMRDGLHRGRGVAAPARREAGTQTEPAATVTASPPSGPPWAMFTTKYGECVHVDRSCRGLASARTLSLKELRPCSVCMLRRG